MHTQNILNISVVLLLGMSFVLLVLWAIYLFCALLGRLFLRIQQAQERALTNALTPITPTEAEAPSTPEEDIPLVIAAIVDRLLEGQSHRIISIKPLGDSSWVEQGRANLFNARHGI